MCNQAETTAVLWKGGNKWILNFRFRIESNVCALERGRHHCKTHIRRSEKRNWLEHEYYLHTDKKVYQKRGD